jgi:hypothetical protein
VRRRARLRIVHRYREKSEPLDLRQRRRTVCHVEHALDNFARAPFRSIGKFRHKWSQCKTAGSRKFQKRGVNFLSFHFRFVFHLAVSIYAQTH